MPTKLIDLHATPLNDVLISGERRGPELRILIYAADPALSRLAQELRSILYASVVPVTDRRLGQEILQQAIFDAILVEEAVVSENPSVLDDLQRWGGEALVMEVNLALASPPRIARQVRGALERRREEYDNARKAALQTLRNELNATVCGLLLEAQLALRRAGPELVPALEHLVSLAEALGRELQA